MNYIVRDNYAFCCSQLLRLITEKYPKLLPTARQQVRSGKLSTISYTRGSRSHSFGAVVQLLWLVRELVKTRTREVRSGCLRLADDALVRYRSGMLITPRIRTLRIQMEPIMISLLRQIVGGDTTSKNIWLVEMLVTIHRENRFVDLRGARSLSLDRVAVAPSNS